MLGRQRGAVLPDDDLSLTMRGHGPTGKVESKVGQLPQEEAIHGHRAGFWL